MDGCGLGMGWMEAYGTDRLVDGWRIKVVSDHRRIEKPRFFGDAKA